MSDNSTINHMAEGWQEDHDALEHCKEQLEYAKSKQYTAVLHLNQVKLRDAEIEALKEIVQAMLPEMIRFNRYKYECNICEKDAYAQEDIEHLTGCPVKRAKELLK